MEEREGCVALLALSSPKSPELSDSEEFRAPTGMLGGLLSG